MNDGLKAEENFHDRSHFKLTNGRNERICGIMVEKINFLCSRQVTSVRRETCSFIILQYLFIENASL